MSKKANTNKSKSNKVNKLKLSSSKRLLIIAVALLAFGALGVYMLRSSNAYTTYYASTMNNSQARKCIQPSDGVGLPPAISMGSKGSCVYALQFGLNNWTNAQVKAGNSKNSPTVGPLVTVDGTFGQATKDKVIAFQKAKGAQGKNVTPNGVVDRSTWAAFFNDCSVFERCN